MPNARGIPIQQQHGQLDDNVPAYNSRLLSQQLFLSGTNSSYNEVPGQNHYWDTVMTTPQLVEFYYTQTKNKESIPRKLEEFDFVVGDPGDTGPKSGIKVLLLEDPGQYGRINVKGHMITTSNVLSLEFDPTIFQPGAPTIDGSAILEPGAESGEGLITASKQDGGWTLESLPKTDDDGDPFRSGRQLGSMTAILRTKGPFIIRHQGSNVTSHIGLQVSRNLHQYFQADANIVSSTSWDDTADGTGNVITIAVGDNLPLENVHSDFPIAINSFGITIPDFKGRDHLYGSDGNPVAAAFLKPLEDERLELVLWGSDGERLIQAARLVPMVTGVGQPDFVVLGEAAKWKGVDGVLAMGFFDHEWQVTPSSVVS